MNYDFLQTLPSLVAISLLGMFIHFLKKNIKGETLVEIRDYFKNHFKSTLVAIITASVSAASYYFTISTGSNADLITVFGLGYMCDSVFNKWDSK